MTWNCNAGSNVLAVAFKLGHFTAYSLRLKLEYPTSDTAVAMQKLTFLQMVQQRTARVAVGASTVRGQRAGMVKTARQYLGKIRLEKFSVDDPEAFRQVLTRETQGFQAALRKVRGSFGIARKLLNIFLHDAFYNVYLQRSYHLNRSERFFELPLDSITAKHLRSHSPALTRWKGVKHLTAAMSEDYQFAAEIVAKEMGTTRVHLDTMWWGSRED
jgi:hypothetical protein